MIARQRASHLLTLIALPGTPKGVAITSDNTQAWVTQNANDSIAIIDLSSRSVLINIFLSSGFGPNFIAMTPNGTQAWVTSNGTNTVAAIDLVDKAVRWTPLAGQLFRLNLLTSPFFIPPVFGGSNGCCRLSSLSKPLFFLQ